MMEYPLSISDVARKLGIQRAAIYIAIREGKLTNFAVDGTKKQRVLESQVVEWNDSRLKRAKPLIFEVKQIVAADQKCLNCDDVKFVYNRRHNTYKECPSCNLLEKVS